MFAVIKPKTLILALTVASLFAAQFAFTGCADEQSTALRMQIYMQPNQAEALCADSSVFRIGAFDMPMVGTPTKSIIWQAEFTASNFCNGGAITLDPVSTQKQTVLVIEALNRAQAPVTTLTRDKETVLGRGLVEPVTWNADELVEPQIILGKVGNFSLVKTDSVVKLPEGVQNLTATTLPDHRVLLVGGLSIKNGNKIYLDDAYIYNPGDMSLITLPENAGFRANHTATLLSDGSVLIVGGEKRGASTAVPVGTNSEIYLFKPNSMSFTKIADLSGRTNHVAVKSHTINGDEIVLIAGGMNYTESGTVILNDAYIYKHATGELLPVPNMTSPRADFSGTALNDGRIAVFGGIKSYVDGVAISQASLELFDPNTNQWTFKEDSTTVDSDVSRYGHKLLHLEFTDEMGAYHEQLAVVGGVSSRNTSGNSYPVGVPMFNTSGDWLTTACSPSIFKANGRAWFAVNEYQVDEKQVFVLSGGAYVDNSPSNKGIVVEPDGIIFAFKYDSVSQGFCNMERTRSYGVINGEPAALDGLPMAVPRYYHAATNLNNGQILLVGGNIKSAVTDTMEMFIEPTENNGTVFTAY